MSNPSRVQRGVPTGGQFAATARGEADVDLDSVSSDTRDTTGERVHAVNPDTPGGTPEERFQHLVAVEPDTDEAALRAICAPKKVAANAGRFYDYLRENGIAADSVTREAAFAYAASALDRPYDDFYDAWMEETAVDLPVADVQAGNPRAEEQREPAAEPVSKPPFERRYLDVDGDQRREMVRQIGNGNIFSISGGRVTGLVDGIELPVSNGYRVRVRLAANDTYTVQRIFTRSGVDRIKGEKHDVFADEVGEQAYRAGMFRSYDENEW